MDTNETSERRERQAGHRGTPFAARRDLPRMCQTGWQPAQCQQGHRLVGRVHHADSATGLRGSVLPTHDIACKLSFLLFIADSDRFRAGQTSASSKPPNRLVVGGRRACSPHSRHPSPAAVLATGGQQDRRSLVGGAPGFVLRIRSGRLPVWRHPCVSSPPTPPCTVHLAVQVDAGWMEVAQEVNTR